MPKYIPAEKLQGMLNAYLSGDTKAEACERFGYSRQVLDNLLKKHGLASRPRGATQEQRDGMVEAYLDGQSMTAAADLFGLTEGACRLELERRGIWYRHNRPSVQEADAMVAAYEAGASMAEAAAPFGYTQKACATALRKAKRRARSIRASDEERARMVAAYQEGKTLAEAASSLGYSSTASKTAINKAGLAARTCSEVHRKYAINEAFFDDIQSFTQGYVLGFIAADGCVADRGCFSMGLARRDRSHLIKIAATMGSEHPVRNYDQKGNDGIIRHGSKLSISSVRLCAALERNGISPRKSLALEPWAGSGSEEAMRGYMLGLWDGDGHIFQEKCRAWVIGFVGTFSVAESFSEYVARLIDEAPVAPFPHASIYKVQWHDLKRCQKIVTCLYQGATIWLDRKRTEADKLLADRSRREKWSHVTAEHLLEMHAKLGQWRLVAKSLGINETWLCSVRRRLGIL